MKNYRHILVGIDFSFASLAAAQTAARLAARHGTPVTAVHVIDPTLAAAMRDAHHSTEEDVFKHISASVHAFLAKSEASSQITKLELYVGHPFAELVDACHRHQGDLLVLGTRGTAHGPNQIGAIAAKCVRKAPADVLLVREEKHQPFQHITACVDLSETSAKAVRAARYIAEDDEAWLDCLFVHQSALLMSLDYSGFVPALPIDTDETAAACKKELDQFVQPLLRTAEGLGWQTVTVERLNIREAILEHIGASRTDLVVLGTRGKTDLRTLLMGTTAERIVTHAPCSILAVKPDGFVYPPPPIVTPIPIAPLV
jgi:nucleotide-binding universal stress UspA family protein